MIVYSHLDGLQQSGLAVIPAAHNQRNALGNGHARNLPSVGQGKGPLHGSRGGKGNAVRHRQVGYAAFPGKHGAVGHERHQLLFL